MDSARSHPKVPFVPGYAIVGIVDAAVLRRYAGRPGAKVAAYLLSRRLC